MSKTLYKRGNISKTLPPEMSKAVMERIRLDCKPCPGCGETTCWTGNNADHMVPAVVEINKMRYSVRRSSRMAAHAGRKIPEGHCIVTNCDDHRCLNPALLVTATQGEVTKRSIDKGLLHNAVHMASMQRARRARNESGMTIEKVRGIRDSDMSQRALAKIHSISRQAVSQIMRYQVWREDANPFAGLGARS